MSASLFLLNITVEILARILSQPKEMQGIRIKKNKRNYYTDDINMYVANPKESINEPWELINECNDTAWCKINNAKLIVSL